MTENDVLFALVAGEIAIRLVKAALSYRGQQRAADRKAAMAKEAAK